MDQAIIGMEVDEKEIKIVEAVRKKGRLEVRVALKLFLDSSVQPEVLIKWKLKQKNIKAKKVSLILKGKGVITKDVEIQGESREHVEAIIRVNLNKYLRVDPAEYEVSYKILGRIAGSVGVFKVLLVAVLKEKIKSVLQLAKEVKLQPIRIGVSLDSIGNIVNGQDYILLNLQQETTSLFLVENGVGVLCKEIEEAFESEKQNTLFQEQMRRVLQFYYSRDQAKELQGVYLIGEQTQKERIANEVQRLFHLPTYQVTYLNNILYPKKNKKEFFSGYGVLFSALLEPTSLFNMKECLKTRG